jgi:hypothetical protein
MRLAGMTVCALLALSAPAFGQQDPSHPKKIMTPEQQQFQQQMREVDAQRQNLRAQAKQAFDAEMAREKSGDCPNATSTYEFNICYGKAVTVTDQNLTTYEKNIRDLLGCITPSSQANRHRPDLPDRNLRPSKRWPSSITSNSSGAPISTPLQLQLSISSTVEQVDLVSRWRRIFA